MAVELSREVIQAGAAYKIKPTITWTGATITAVTAVLVDSPDGNSQTTKITTELSLTGGPNWSGILDATETAKLLADPLDILGRLKYQECYLVLKITGTDADADPLTPVLYSSAIKVDKAFI